MIDGVVGAGDPLAAADPGLLTSLLLEVFTLTVLLPADHPLAPRASAAWAALAEARWIDAPLLSPPFGPGAASLVERRHGRTRYTGDDALVLTTLVAAGHGLALSSAARAETDAGVRSLPLTDPALVHRVEVVALRSVAGDWAPLLPAVAAAGRTGIRPSLT